MHVTTDEHKHISDRIDEIELPDPGSPSAEELERRRTLFDRTMRLREKIGPIGVRSDELKHLARQEA